MLEIYFSKITWTILSLEGGGHQIPTGTLVVVHIVGVLKQEKPDWLPEYNWFLSHIISVVKSTFLLRMEIRLRMPWSWIKPLNGKRWANHTCTYILYLEIIISYYFLYYEPKFIIKIIMCVCKGAPTTNVLDLDSSPRMTSTAKNLDSSPERWTLFFIFFI